MIARSIDFASVLRKSSSDRTLIFVLGAKRAISRPRTPGAGSAMTRGGSFVAVSSTAADFSTRYLASYSAGKAGMDALVRVAADELGPRAIRVN